MSAPISIGVDNGGTWIRLKGLDAKGRCVWSLRKPSPTVDKLPLFLKKHLKRFQGSLSSLAVGSRGVWTQAKRHTVKRALKGLARTIVVMSDVEAAWLAAFAPSTGEGIIVIAGTGSIAYGRRADGTFGRAGGLGPQKGDEGSGYWMGREWLKRNGRAEDQTKNRPVRAVAALAPSVIQKAMKGNSVARGIVKEAQDHLSELVVHMTHTLEWKKEAPLAVSGSVLENKWFGSGFLRALRVKRIRFRRLDRKTDPAIAAVLSASRSIINYDSR